jgi:hypothetical protein
MAKRKRTPDPAVFGFNIMQGVAAATGDTPAEPEPDPNKDPAAVALGRRGGLKGGPARAKSLGKKKLSAIGKKMAAARWKKRRS